jgi:hypothetical protein
MKKESTKRTILLDTSHEMRKEIAEKNKKNTKCHRWQPKGKEIKQERKFTRGNVGIRIMAMKMETGLT